MKTSKQVIGFITSLLCIFLTVSCEKDFLDKTPDEDLTEADIFQDRGLIEDYLTATYFNLPIEFNFANDWGLNPYVGAADEMDMPFSNVFANLMNSGGWGTESVGNNPTPDIWNNAYKGLRKTNIFIKNIDDASISDSDKRSYKGEAIFLRAFYNFLLVRLYGPVPIFNEAVDPAFDFSTISRTPLVECVDLIVKDCDEAADLLSLALPENKYGRASAASALALKSRVLLYLASPLFNGNPDYQNMVNAQGNKLFPTADPNRWQIAADAAKSCIDESEAAGYKLFESSNPYLSYQQLFIVPHNSEILFSRNLAAFDRSERLTSPSSLGGWSGLCPIQNMLDDYEMVNGEQPISGYDSDGQPDINPNSGYTEVGFATEAHPEGYYPAGISNMFVDRDPRFYASINFQGQEWRGRILDFRAGAPDGQSPGPDYSTTGYLIRKFSDPNVDIIKGQFSLKAWIFFRLGEQYLNYAEALNEAQGPIADVYKYVNLIRSRVNMPALPQGLSKDEMRKKIWHERRIELAFETERYFDTRRWKIAEEELAGPIYGMNVTDRDLEGFLTRTFVENRVFVAPKHYLWPIPQSEINKNQNLVQNVGW